MEIDLVSGLLEAVLFISPRGGNVCLCVCVRLVCGDRGLGGSLLLSLPFAWVVL